MTPLQALALGWLAGVWLSGQIEQPAGAWLAFSGLAAASLALLWRAQPRLRLALAATVMLGLGAARLAGARPPENDLGFIATYIGRGQVQVEGVVAAAPTTSEAGTRLKLRAEQIWLPGATRPLAVRGQVLVYAPRYSEPRLASTGAAEFRYGDRLRVHGQLEAPLDFDGFSYRGYLARQGIYVQLRAHAHDFLGAGQGPQPWQALFDFRTRALAVVRQLFPEPHAALLAGILLGDDSGLPAALSRAFQVTSTAHIIAISGFNIAVLAGVITAITRRVLGPHRGLRWAVLGIAAYTLLVGADAAVVRAAIMGTLALLAQRLGRRSHGLNALGLAAAAMTLFNPGWLWEAGFQLSALATLGLVLYADPFEAWTRRRLERWVSPGRARRLAALGSEWFLVTFAAQLATLPITLVLFEQVSLVALLANFIILPAQPAVMISSGMALLLGLLWLPLGQVAAWLAWPFSAYTIAWVQWLAALPGAAFHLGPVAPALALTAYAALFTLTWLASRPAEQRPAWWRALAGRPASTGGLLLLGASALLAWSWYFSLPEPGRLRLTVLDVAEAGARGGEAVLVQGPGGSTVLVNGGPGGHTLAGHLAQRLPLFTQTIDLLVVASAGEPHLTALPEALERYQVGQAVVTASALAGSGGTATRATLAALHQQGAAITEASTLPAFDLGGGAILQVLADTPRGSVLRLEWGNFSALLAPGLDAAAETSLAARGLIAPATALLLAQGGAAGANSAAWLRAASPQVVLVSNYAGSGWPEADVVARLAGSTVLGTDVHDSIVLETDGKRLWVGTER